jgi:hypothetical protein
VLPDLSIVLQFSAFFKENSRNSANAVWED